jgi:hypothetical protein
MSKVVKELEIKDKFWETQYQKDGLNDYFRFCKYEKHEIFAIHQDGSYLIKHL